MPAPTLTTLAVAAHCLLAAQAPRTVLIDRDNVSITKSCIVRFAPRPIADADGNGVVHITGNEITVEFAADSPTLTGAKPSQSPDAFAGKGIVITGRNVTLANAKVSGFKVGIHAVKADGLTIHDCDVSGNFAQHLKSTPQAEDAGDWLWPHANDDNEWIGKYGAGLCVEDSNNVTLCNILARKTQNGIILDAVNDSKLYDCDCSFLSGWGLAMWRSNRNVISRNAFDFCVRGYSHGVYNRGQDSAGILMFEQCCENVIADNSCTHCGDGFFGFAGKEALGEVNPKVSPSAYKHRGNNGNTFARNDFSFAAAHGLELTFSFRNRISENVFRDNAICGIWAGYSQAAIIDHNLFFSNGGGAYGMERGGINIEHGRYNLIAANRFEEDQCGVHLWWDEDKELMQSIWARANEPQSSDNRIVGNEFARMPVAIQLRQTTRTEATSNAFEEVEKPLDADAASAVDLHATPTADISKMNAASAESAGKAQPVGARDRLTGRENIIMTEWGPWDHQSPLLRLVRHDDGADEYRLLGSGETKPTLASFHVTKGAELEMTGDLVRVRSNATNALTPYQLAYKPDDASTPLVVNGTIIGGAWTVWTFPSSVDPREHADQWRRDGESKHHELACGALDFPFNGGGMTEVRHLPTVLPRDHFGVIATRSLTIPKGTWRINTTSDDGLRVWMDDRLVIDDWTWHGSTKHSHDFEIAQPREVKFRVEYFELDGAATLRVDIAPAK